MTPEGSGPLQTTSAAFTIEGEHFRMQSRVTVPAGPARVSDLLPLARGLSDAVVRETCRAVEGSGELISCRKGCGACCRNLVAISEVEARRLREVIEGLPEPRRSAVRALFAEARQRLERAGLLETLHQAGRWTDEAYTAMARNYFRQGIPCPFLEEEACSIYEERPITCREYLVTSPPELCASPDSKGVRRVRLPLRVFNAVARWQVPPAEHFLERWVPLILAPEWAEAHPEEPPPRPGPELLRELLVQLDGSGGAKSEHS
jgi:Fe-S-cluster containining protein